jgi:hypothetical protein
MSITDLAGSVTKSKALILAEQELESLREERENLDAQLNVLLQDEDENNRYKNRQIIKETRARKLQLEDQIIAARKAYGRERGNYLAAVQKVLAPRKAEALAGIAKNWSGLLESWNQLDQVNSALAAAGVHFPISPTKVGAIRRLIGGQIDRIVGGQV